MYKKINSFLSFHPPIFYLKYKRHKRRRTFFEMGVGNSLKRKYVEGGGRGGGGTCKTNKGGGGPKTGSLERTYFLNDPFCLDPLPPFPAYVLYGWPRYRVSVNNSIVSASCVVKENRATT